MASLTQVSIITRKVIRYGLFAILGIILVRGIILTGIRIYRYFYPEPPAPPTVSFGKLPKLPFPVKDVPQLTYRLETPTGELPVLPEQMKVYFMPKPTSQLLSLDNAKAKAQKLGFKTVPSQVTETVYSFNHPDVPAELKISIVTNVFTISYNLEQDPSPLLELPPPPEIATTKARAYLSGPELLPADLSGPTESEPVVLEGNKIIGAGSLSEANFVKVNFFRKAYEDYPSLTSEPGKGNVWLIVSGDSQKEKLIVAAQYHYFPVDEEKSATYPIKLTSTAWEQLNSGGGYIASVNPSATNIVVRRVYLAYYDAGVTTDFFQPIIVFEGDNNFVGYVPAVTSDYYGE